LHEALGFPIAQRNPVFVINAAPTRRTAMTMNAYATIELLSNGTSNGRTVRRALVEISTETGEWLASFTALGFTVQELKDRGYLEADANAKSKGYTLQSIREVS
jgi:hypothetical protein